MTGPLKLLDMLIPRAGTSKIMLPIIGMEIPHVQEDPKPKPAWEQDKLATVQPCT